MVSTAGESSYVAIPAALHTPLLPENTAKRRPSAKMICLAVTGMLGVALLLVAALDYKTGILSDLPMLHDEVVSPMPHSTPAVPRGVAEGVSAKSAAHLLRQSPFAWSNQMLGWQRTAYHFQPEKNWMNGKLITLITFIYQNLSCPFALMLISTIYKSKI